MMFEARLSNRDASSPAAFFPPLLYTEVCARLRKLQPRSKSNFESRICPLSWIDSKPLARYRMAACLNETRFSILPTLIFAAVADYCECGSKLQRPPARNSAAEPIRSRPLSPPPQRSRNPGPPQVPDTRPVTRNVPKANCPSRIPRTSFASSAPWDFVQVFDTKN